jgi:hypothetical protein
MNTEELHMNPKQMIMIGTLAFALTLGSFTGNSVSRAGAATDLLNLTDSADPDTSTSNEDEFLESLGVSSDEQVYESLLQGVSLAELAASRNKDVEALVQLQMNEMTAQLDARLAQGHISISEYEAQRSELKDILTRSAYGNPSDPVH